MQIILADAKIMFDKADIKAETKPLFQSEADNIAAEMAVKDIAELENMRKTGNAIKTSTKQKNCQP